MVIAVVVAALLPWWFTVKSGGGAARRGMSRIKSPDDFCADSTTYKPNYIFRGIV